MRKISSLHYMRGLMTILVILSHANLIVNPQLFHGIFILGKYGVDFFFVLSGFLIIYSLNKRSNIITYLYKRFVRIFPVYWLYTLIVLAGSKCIYKAIGRMLISWINLDAGGIIRSLLLLPMNEDIGEMPILPTAWTLGYEVFFYVVSLILIIYGEKRFLQSITIWFLLIVFGNTLINFDSLYVKFLVNPLFCEFFFGIIIAILIKKYTFKKIYGIISLCTGIVWLVLSCLIVNIQIYEINKVSRLFSFGLPFTFLVLGLVILDNRNINSAKSKIVHILSFCGDASYSLYLTHYITILLVNYALEVSNIISISIIRFLIVVFTCIITGGGSYLIIEKSLTKTLLSRRGT